MPKKKDKHRDRPDLVRQELKSDADRRSVREGEDGSDSLSVLTSVSYEPEADIALSENNELEDIPADDENSAADRIEQKLKENMEYATNKNTSVRSHALKQLQTLLASSYVPDFLDDWKVTFMDCIEKNMKKGVTAESVAAVRLCALLCIQIGENASGCTEKQIGLLRSLVSDSSLSPSFRAECALALALCSFLVEREIENISLSLSSLHEAWSNQKVCCSPESAPVFCSCQNAWSFLLLQLPTHKLKEVIKNDVPKVAAFLSSTHLEVRLAAAESLALLYALAYEIDEEYRPTLHQSILETLHALATDSVKYHAKRDRKVQRASLRDVYSAVKDGTGPEMTVKFGAEVLELNTWSAKLCYDTFCRFLGGGMNVHLKQNVLLRNYFDLGPAVLDSKLQRLSKLERLSINQSLSKARSLVRGKQREKRVATFNS